MKCQTEERIVKGLIIKPLLSIFLPAIFMLAFFQASQAQTIVNTEIARKCSDEADARGLHGPERKEFRSRCKANGVQAAPPVVDRQPRKNIAKPVLPDPVVVEPKTAARPQQQPQPVATAPDVTTAPIATTKVYGRRIALVIGNSSYKHVAALTNPRNDATSIAD